MTLTIATEAPVETDGASSALETLEPGASVEVEVTEDGQVVRSIKARQAKVEGTIAEIEGNEVTVESERGRRFTVTVNDRTRINLEDDFPGTLADLQVSTEVEIKFDPESRVAFKIDAEEEEADIKGVVVAVDGDEVTIETERGRSLTLVIGNRTRIELEDDFPCTVADIQVGTEVESKFDPSTRTAVKIELEEADEKRRQVEKPQAQPTPAPLQEPLGTHEPPSPEAPTANFRLLISDDRNAIDDFTHLWVTIDHVGIQQGGESGSWQELEVPEEHRKVDLVEVIGDAAVEIIRTQIPPGRYSKVFIHVDDVTGELQSGITTPVKLPSSKLQIVKGFEVQTGSVTSFVFDITVVAAGNENRGIKYIIKPVIAQSGADRPFKDVKPERVSQGELTLQLEGDPQPGATSTLVVTDADGNPVEGAAVSLKVEWDAGTTDADGRLTIDIPMGTTEFRIEAESEDLEGELQAEFLEDGTVEIETDDEELGIL